MCELCKEIETKDGYIIRGDWTDLTFEKVEDNYIESPYKVFAYGEGIASIEIFYCPMCGRKLGS